MAKCQRCGKKGIFLKVNAAGLCNDCQLLVQFEQERAALESAIEQLKSTQREQTAALEQLNAELADRQAFRAKIVEQTIAESTKEIEQALEEKRRALSYCEQDTTAMQEKLHDLQEQAVKADAEWRRATTKAHTMREAHDRLRHVVTTYTNMSPEGQGFLVPGWLADLEDSYEPTVKLKLHSSDLKDLRSRYRQVEKQIDDTLDKYRSRYTTKAYAAIYQLMVLALRAELQNILFGLRFGKLEEAQEQVKDMIAKYLKIATEGNQNIASTMVRFIGEIEYLFQQAVEIEYEYYTRKEKIKEEQRALREQMRQEAEERKRLAEQRKQVEKEESKYQTEIQNLSEQLKTADAEKVAALQERIAQLQSQLGDVEKKKEEITRLQNGQAGYVYVISNLGSFGDDVFKIGMTRRLEPQERVDELGSASVPFPFDVHSFIFSNNAAALEGDIHKRLNSQRVNKVNYRKEFFRLPLDELEALVQELDPTAEFNRTMAAEQYKQSLSADAMNMDDLSEGEEGLPEDDE